MSLKEIVETAGMVASVPVIGYALYELTKKGINYMDKYVGCDDEKDLGPKMDDSYRVNFD